MTRGSGTETLGCSIVPEVARIGEDALVVICCLTVRWILVFVVCTSLVWDRIAGRDNQGSFELIPLIEPSDLFDRFCLVLAFLWAERQVAAVGVAALRCPIPTEPDGVCFQ